MEDIKIIREEVTKLLNTDDSGHNMDHINRVCKIALSIADKNTNSKIITAIALLHDVDDYKLFGLEQSKDLTNAKMILSKTSFSKEEKNKIINSIKTIGYSKRIAGVTPDIKEAMVVSDADMLDAMGALGILRSYHYNITHGNPFFTKEEFPNLDMNETTYKTKAKGTVVNHIFEKLLRLKDLMLTKKGKAEASRRHEFLIEFLKEYFYEEDAKEWQEYLNKYIEKNDN